MSDKEFEDFFDFGDEETPSQDVSKESSPIENSQKDLTDKKISDAPEEEIASEPLKQNLSSSTEDNLDLLFDDIGFLDEDATSESPEDVSNPAAEAPAASDSFKEDSLDKQAESQKQGEPALQNNLADAPPKPTSADNSEEDFLGSISGETLAEQVQDNDLLADGSEVDSSELFVETPTKDTPKSSSANVDSFSEVKDEKSQKLSTNASSQKDFSQTAVEKTSQPEEDVDDLFADFLTDDEPEVLSSMESVSEDTFTEEAASPLVEKLVPEVDMGGIPPDMPTELESTDDVLQSEDGALEDLFSEVEASDDSIGGSDLFSAEASTPAVSRFESLKKIASKKVILSIFASFLGLLVVFFFTGLTGILGLPSYKDISGEKDEYNAPNATQLSEINGILNSIEKKSDLDRYDLYTSGAQDLSAALKIDVRNRKVLTKLVENLSKTYEFMMDSASRKSILGHLKVLDEYYPDFADTILSKARYEFSNLNHAAAKKLLNKSDKMSKSNFFSEQLKGEIAFKENRIDTAIEHFEKAILKNRNNHRAKYFMAKALQKSEKFEEAQVYLTQIIEADGLNIKAKLLKLKIDLVLEISSLAETEAAFENILVQNEKYISPLGRAASWRYLATLSEKQGALEKAIERMENATRHHSLDVDNLAYLGKLYIDYGEFQKASESYRKATSIDGTKVEHFVFFGRALRLSGEADDAVTELKKALEKNPDDQSLLFELGVSQRALLQNNEAAQTFQKVLSQDEQHVPSMVELGEVDFEQNRMGEAQKMFESALTIDAKNYRAYNGLGNVQLALQQREKALVNFKNAEKFGGPKLATLLNLSKSYLQLNRINESKVYVEKARELAEGDEAVSAALASFYLKSKQWTKARDIYQSMIESNPKTYQARMGLAEVYLLQKEPQSAIIELEEASKYKQNHYPIVLMLGKSWRAAGDLQSALDVFREAEGLRPESPEVHHEIQLTYIYKNNVDLAQKSMEKALKLDPKFVAPLVAMGNYYLSINLYERAAEYYNKALEIDSKDVNILLTLADLYKRRKKNRQAISYYKKAISANPKNAQAYLGLGLLADEGRDPKLAQQYYLKANAADPLNPRPYYYLGFIYKHFRANKKSAMAFQKYLELNPNSKERDDILDQIRRLKGL